MITLASCYSAKRIMYTNLDSTGTLFLSHYTSFFPSLGSCGFSRDEDSYHITVPRIIGRIESNQLEIYNYDTAKCSYTGYIEFLIGNKIYVDLYKTSKGIKKKLTINGKHTIKIEDNTIGEVKKSKR